ncbi:hypothetical protein [Halorubrum sp. BV1]|uniref:hypothetical protein n=1 Tax=Halorubrum sp. BV1 TaxID=1498500 RepID=UPI000A991701|nr:hypothetical protein [Halorubrum sp. BV1]
MHVLGGDRDAEPVRVVDDTVNTDAVREGVRCSDHAKDFLEVSCIIERKTASG